MVPLAINAHLMLAGPLSGRIIRAGNIKSGRKPPFPTGIHQKCDVFSMIIPIVGKQFEQHTIELHLQHISAPQTYNQTIMNLCKINNLLIILDIEYIRHS